MKIRLAFRWYDFWIGVYYDRHEHVVYVCPLPTILVAVALPRECSNCGKTGSHNSFCVRGTFESERRIR